MRAYKIHTANTTQLISTTDAKNFLKVDTTDDDDLIDKLVVAATESAQEYTNRFFLNTIIEQHGTTFADLSELYKSPAVETSWLKYYDTDNVEQTLASSVYYLNDVIQPSQITLAVDQSWPSIADRQNAVSIKYTVGYGAATTDVPDAIIQAVYLTIGHWYANRQDVVIGRIATQLPMTVKYLLDQYKVQVIR